VAAIRDEIQQVEGNFARHDQENDGDEQIPVLGVVRAYKQTSKVDRGRMYGSENW
jgi:hypothetical protein